MDETKEREKRGSKSGRRRRTWQECEKLVQEYKESGLTQGRFAARAGVHIGTLRRWLTQKKERLGDKGSGQFTAVRLSGGKAGSVTLRLPQGIEVEIASELEGAEVASLVRELLHSCLR